MKSGIEEDIGLSTREAEEKLKLYGLNIIEKKKQISGIKIFLSQFNDFITWVLIVATIISALMGERADAITILIIIIMNSILGFIQEFRTEKSLEALKEMAAPTAKVVRNKKLQVINGENLVPGDLIILDSGDRIPADGRLISGDSFKVDESLLTGESLGVQKSPKEDKNIFMGTILLVGKGSAIVTKTGMKTEMGKIADLLENIEEEKSPLKKKLADFGRILVILCILICIIVTVLGVLRGEELYKMFLLGVSLAVAAIPEGLTAIVTVALALGVSRMLKKKALVRKLPAVETLGCTSIICSDKTGTLTENKMTVKTIYLDEKIYNSDDDRMPKNTFLKDTCIFCNDCNFNFNAKNLEEALIGDPTETALIKLFPLNVKELESYLKTGIRTYSIPFDSERKMMSVIIKSKGKSLAYIKGAPERVIEKCVTIYENGERKIFTKDHKSQVNKAVEVMSLKGMRCIAIAFKDRDIEMNKSIENGLNFIAIVGITDPPRPEVKDAVIKCKNAGIRPIMITGDHKNTAFAIGSQLSICKDISQVITGEELDKMSDRELSKKVETISIFARVSPNHKLKIVRCFKKKGHIVAMTGDGVNDAPAVKEADIGVAMGISGTDVTKEAAAMILLDDNFGTIVAAVEEGRIIYSNIRKFIRYLLSCNLGEVLTMFLASLFHLETPLIAIQILLVNLATDGLPAIALGVDPPDKDIMNYMPRGKKESIFSKGLGEKILIRGFLIGVCTLLSFIVASSYGLNLELCRTITLATLIMSQLIHVFECKSERYSLFELNIFSNKYLVIAVALSISMLLVIIYVPFFQTIFYTKALNLGQWFIVIFFSGIIALINSVYLYISNKSK